MFDAKTYNNKSPTYSQQQAANRMYSNINQELNQSLQTDRLINIINELGELIEDCATNPEAGFLRGVFKDQFDPDRLAFPPPKKGKEDHTIWTKYLR